MNLKKMFEKTLKATIDVAVTPIEAVKDVATMFGALTDQNEPYTMQRLKKAKENLGEAYDAIDSEK